MKRGGSCFFCIYPDRQKSAIGSVYVGLQNQRLSVGYQSPGDLYGSAVLDENHAMILRTGLFNIQRLTNLLRTESARIWGMILTENKGIGGKGLGYLSANVYCENEGLRSERCMEVQRNP